MEQGISAGDSAQAAIQADFRRPCLTYNQLSPMSYQVLARKYRPQKFSEVIGQEHVTRTLKNAIEQGRTAHGYIFSGHRGIGKTTVARILAMALNCRSSDKPVPEPCGVCDSCTEIRAGRFEEIVGQLKDLIGRENIEADEDALALLAEAGDGSMRDALSILDQAIASSSGRLTAEQVRNLVGAAPSGVLEDVMRAVAQGSSEEVLRLVDKLLTEGHSPAHFARQMVRFLRNTTVAKIAGADSSLLQISRDERQRVARVAELFSEEDLARHLQIMLRTHGEIGYRTEQRFHLELGLLKMAHAQRLLPIEQLLSEAGVPSAARPAGKPAIVPEARKAEGSSVPRPGFVSPFAADSARKSKTELSSQSNAAASIRSAPRIAGSVAAPVVMGSAAPAAAPQAALEESEEMSRQAADSGILRDAVLRALSDEIGRASCR